MSFVVVDFDGCLVNDVSETFKRFLRSSNSRLENIYKETIFDIVDSVPFVFSKAAKKIDFKKALNQNVITGLKDIQNKGIEIVVRTANTNLKDIDIEDIKEELQKRGLEVKIERVKDNKKCESENGEKPILIIDDNPKVIRSAIKNGINSILILTDYNMIEAKFLSKINSTVCISDPNMLEEKLKDYKFKILPNKNLSIS
jgi:predicted peroxiredoxin